MKILDSLRLLREFFYDLTQDFEKKEYLLG